MNLIPYDDSLIMSTYGILTVRNINILFLYVEDRTYIYKGSNDMCIRRGDIQTWMSKYFILYSKLYEDIVIPELGTIPLEYQHIICDSVPFHFIPPIMNNGMIRAARDIFNNIIFYIKINNIQYRLNLIIDPVNPNSIVYISGEIIYDQIPFIDMNNNALIIWKKISSCIAVKILNNTLPSINDNLTTDDYLKILMA